tara:strand:- start:289 stop:759 length:471 start_codon:yes stop_codon:yes gene_type:complete
MAKMNKRIRRKILNFVGILLTSGMLPLKSFAIEWDKKAFNESLLDKSLRLIGAANVSPSEKIDIKVPQIAENGTIVPIEITSKIQNTKSIYVFVEKNPSPLTAQFFFKSKTLPFVSSRIKMRESSRLLILVKTSSDEFFRTERFVKVTIGGCGEDA